MAVSGTTVTVPDALEIMAQQGRGPFKVIDANSEAAAGSANTITLTEAQKVRDEQGRAIAPTIVIVQHKPASATATGSASPVMSSVTASSIVFVSTLGTGVPHRVFYA